MILKRPASAKINLGLHVLRKRNDGYHDLETVFYRIGWADHLTFEAADTITLTCSDPALSTNESNLVMKSGRLLAAETGTPQGAAIHLEKHLPYGAGLGGGSSDAATTLHALSDLWRLDLSRDTLHDLGAELGSDVPFFLGTDAAYATGRGERLTPLVDEAGATYVLPYALVVVVPPVHVATTDAYSRVQPNDANRPDLREVVLSNNLARWRAELVNDFEQPVLAQYPAIGAAKALLLDAGAGYAAMSGSGAAVFGVFEDATHATAAAEAARQTGHRVWHGVT